MAGGLLPSGGSFLSPGVLIRLCVLDLSRGFSSTLFSKCSQIWRVDGVLMTMAGEGFRSYPGRVDKDTLPATVFFWHVGKGACATVILLKTGFCSGGGGRGADSPGGGKLFTPSERFGGPGTGMVGFFWKGTGGGLMGGWGTGGGKPLEWWGTGGGG